MVRHPIGGEAAPGEAELPVRERRREVKAVLKAAYRDHDIHMTKPRRYGEATVGLQLADRFVSYLEVLAMAHRLPWRQRRCLELALGQAWPYKKIAKALAVSEETVRRDIREALDGLIGWIYA